MNLAESVRDSRCPRLELLFLAAIGLVCGGCFSTVTLPETIYYRLRAPQPPLVVPPGLEADGVRAPGSASLTARPRLAVRDVILAADLAHDRMMVQEGEVTARFFEFHQWSGPLDRLVADAFRTGLVRSQRFGDVGQDAVSADLVLDIRVHSFGLGVQDGGWVGDAEVEFRLADARSERVVFCREVRQATPVLRPDPEPVASALSVSLDRLLLGFLAECEAASVFEAPLSGAEQGLASPPR